MLRQTSLQIRPQRGAALLIFALILTIGLLGAFLSRLNSATQATQRDQITSAALAQAKEALIGYALGYPETHQVGGANVYVPGHLPCPDTGGGTEGKETSPCGTKGVTVIGQLPWSTLGLPPLKDADGNCLWYAVSGNFKANPKADLLSRDTVGQFRIVDEDGATALVGAVPATQAIAVIFSAGPPVSGQMRANNGGECGKDYDTTHFLDAFGAANNHTPNATAESLSILAARGPTDSFNDRLLWITPEDLFQRGVDKRSDLASSLFNTSYVPTGSSPALAQRIAECIADFGSNNTYHRLPWAAPITLTDQTPNTFQNDNFDDAANSYVGRVPFLIWTSHQATGKTNPKLGASCSSSSSTACRLLRTDHCPVGWNLVAGPPSVTNSLNGWWDKWKDHFFYAVAEDFKPNTAVNSNCASAKCLYVDSNGPYAGLIIFADRAQSGQTRATLADKNSPANYLEAENAAAIINNNPANMSFGKFKRTGNDKFVCIKPDFTIDATCSSIPGP